ncbi:hypothetical protein GCM10009797_31360 [Nocardioides hwasunensis]
MRVADVPAHDDDGAGEPSGSHLAAGVGAADVGQTSVEHDDVDGVLAGQHGGHGGGARVDGDDVVSGAHQDARHREGQVGFVLDEQHGCRHGRTLQVNVTGHPQNGKTGGGPGRPHRRGRGPRWRDRPQAVSGNATPVFAWQR